MVFAWKASGLTCERKDADDILNRYNKYLSIAARVVRRSLKDDKRVIAEKRGETQLRFAKWTDGKQGEVYNVAEAKSGATSADATN